MKKGINTKKRQAELETLYPTFIDVLNNPAAKRLVEELEWGSSDKDLEQTWMDDLKRLTGWSWVS